MDCMHCTPHPTAVSRAAMDSLLGRLTEKYPKPITWSYFARYGIKTVITVAIGSPTLFCVRYKICIVLLILMAYVLSSVTGLGTGLHLIMSPGWNLSKPFGGL